MTNTLGLEEAAVSGTSAVNERLRDHYTECFEKHGISARGVDWHDEESLEFHYDKMLSVIRLNMSDRPTSILDVGCGYGGLYQRALKRGLSIDYTGIDLVRSMVDAGRTIHPQAQFMAGDILSMDIGQTFDYVVANGVLTEKLGSTIPEFSRFARALIKRLYSVAEIGIAFNMMTSNVNFMADNLYYQNPGEILSFCTNELSTKVVLDHSYRYYDFTMYVYR